MEDVPVDSRTCFWELTYILNSKNLSLMMPSTWVLHAGYCGASAALLAARYRPH